ncbi:K(+)/H(+) antiporter-like protein 1 [Eremomyces bilateralis CBS 781.70]|uniref:K(+)/H(+) antiporter-like protein 1 n=1 Tax=Eremomyces bilateralis CBS 781.70 TaxID=1392243 RepID=A0A6G1FXN8_9PEZI|nr:K(+)/H(+) antiporter-like protein 1 [Eremomyces bilateralis CBS 781.70]KAF1810450.1 K(+)/H(+) antiporter-like protein 1 [Eremomyces bilateralis CBS 781.70]
MGRIPGFTESIFPTVAMDNLNLVANLGLVLYLFFVGVEVDLRFLVSNWKVALSVGLVGMILPFGLGSAIAWGLYHEFGDEPGLVPISFGVFMLFVGVAMAITAFPVLCRILTELKLLSTTVGVIVLSAGVGNDVVGWILLALCVALVNAGSGLTALWVLLICVGYTLFLVFAVRPPFIWVLRRTRSLQDGPSQSVVALTLLIALASAFFTGVIGVHPIFGAFMAGLICPHEGGFAIKLTEKLEDLIGSIFLPLYFALSGLNTNLGLLNTGLTWGYVIGIIVIAFTTKFAGASVAARLNGLVWRESFTIGALMSCKGLVELIVLNIGLQAKILSTRTFTMFVVMALITTLVTTPLTSALYPPWYQQKLEKWKRGEIDWDTGKPLNDSTSGSGEEQMAEEKMELTRVRKMLVYLRLDNMPALLMFMTLIGGKPQDAAPRSHPSERQPTDEGEEIIAPVAPVQAHGIRLIELTERDSSVMRVTEVEEFSIHDPVINTFRTFGKMHNLAVSGETSIIPSTSFAEALVSRASSMSSDLVLLPWSETGSMSEAQDIRDETIRNKLDDTSYVQFVTEAFADATCNMAVFVNRNFGGTVKRQRPQLSRSKSALSVSSGKDATPSAPITDASHHVFVPFFGGSDDRIAVRLVLQLAANPEITATIVHFDVPDNYFDDPLGVGPDLGSKATDSRVITYIPSKSEDTTFFAAIKNTLTDDLAPRVRFKTVSTLTPRATAIETMQEELGQNVRNAGDLLVVGRNVGMSAALGREGLDPKESTGGVQTDANRCIGVLAEEVVRSGLLASVLVVQARGSGLEL